MRNFQADPSPVDPDREVERARLVDEQIMPRGIKDPAVLAAMRHVPRHRFVPAMYASSAYIDGPLPIGHGRAISQPSLVAMMTETLTRNKTDKVSEVGTGSGYQAAILAELAERVLTIEILEPLVRRAERTLAESGYGNVRVRVATATKAGPRRLPSMPSSSPPRPITCPSHCSITCIQPT